MELAGAHASKIGKHKFGYERSPELTQRGAQLLLYKHIFGLQVPTQPTYTINPTMSSNTRSRPGDHHLFPTKHPDQKRGHKTMPRAVDHPEDVQRSKDGVVK